MESGTAKILFFCLLPMGTPFEREDYTRNKITGKEGGKEEQDVKASLIEYDGSYGDRKIGYLSGEILPSLLLGLSMLLDLFHLGYLFLGFLLLYFFQFFSLLPIQKCTCICAQWKLQ